MLKLRSPLTQQTQDVEQADPERGSDPKNRAGREPMYFATIIIPAYNEEEALPHVLHEVFSVVDERYEVLVVDDGSQDGTAEVAAQFPCVLISHSENQGKGAAMRTGIAAARGARIIFTDGDATYPASAIPDVVAHLDGHDLVRCVRSTGRNHIPLLNRFGNSFFNGVIGLLHQVEGSDVLSGMYGLHAAHLRAMRLESSGFDIETEIMVKARTMGLRSHTMPIVYGERIGEKKLLPLRDGMKIMARVLKLAVMLNPFLLYFLPGMLLWTIGLGTLLLGRSGAILTPFLSLGVHTLLFSVMLFLAGFQLFFTGCMVKLYAVQSGLRQHGSLLRLLISPGTRRASLYAGLTLAGAGLLWCGALFAQWLLSRAGLFSRTEALVSALSLMVWGIQLISAGLFLALFVRQAPLEPAPLSHPAVPNLMEREI